MPMPSATHEIDRDDQFAPAVEPMHTRSAEERLAFLAMLKKDGKAHREITDSYVNFWQNDDGTVRDNSEEERRGRVGKYASLVNK